MIIREILQLGFVWYFAESELCDRRLAVMLEGTESQLVFTELHSEEMVGVTCDSVTCDFVTV